jgi:hypothetical protein
VALTRGDTFSPGHISVRILQKATTATKYKPRGVLAFSFPARAILHQPFSRLVDEQHRKQKMVSFFGLLG